MSTTSPIAHLRALERLRAGGDSIAVNLGTGSGHSVREVIAAAEAVSGCTVPARGRAAAARATRRHWSPTLALAAEMLGWQAQHSDLDTIIRTALAWHTRRSE